MKELLTLDSLQQSEQDIKMGIFTIWGFFGYTVCGMQDLSSPTRDQTHAPCSGSAESQVLDHQKSLFVFRQIKF